MKRKILILTNDLDKHSVLIERLSDADTSITVALCSDLSFYINGADSEITLFSTGEELRTFQKILVLSTPEHDKNHSLSALACYCRKFHLPLYDDVFTNTSGKLYELWRLWEHDLPVAKTLFGPSDFLIRSFPKLNGPGVLKAVHGTRGKDNYLIKTTDALRQILADNPNTPFILQNFIPNDGDWRIIVMESEPKLALYRSSHGRDHRNNTSVGGDTSFVPLSEVDPQILQLAVDASRALDIKIAGADILPEKDTKQLSVLEVNRTPQLVTAGFLDVKTKALKDLINA